MKVKLFSAFLLIFVITFSSCNVSHTGRSEVFDSTYIKFNRAPFFPIAMYTWCADIVTDTRGSELDILKSAGFNLIDAKFNDTARNKYLDFMDRCKSREINVIVEGNTEEATRGSNNPLFFKSIIIIITRRCLVILYLMMQIMGNIQSPIFRPCIQT